MSHDLCLLSFSYFLPPSSLVLAIMGKKGRKKADEADIHLPGGALQITFAVEGAIITYIMQ